ncbi:MAG: phosphoribosylanthranilate isomerase [Chloroflexi bacterium]|nr:phosphoribosylanthranilate isomerase [Chloroflexota bacterium]
MIKVKICGITNLEDALMALEAGADMLGFIFAASPRQINLDRAREIIPKLPPGTRTVGVFVDSEIETVRSVAHILQLHRVQLHGAEPPEYCQALGPGRVIKAFRVRDETVLDIIPAYEVDALLLDSYDPSKAGGTGRTFNWDIARDAGKYGKIILSGGLNPENVKEAIARVEPYGVDVSSGVETAPGKKDPRKVRAFIRAARGVVSPES